MAKRTRTILFLIFLFLFLLITPSAILYSQGFRFDINSKKITRTGAFYFKVFPKSAEIYLDSKLKKKTDFFFGSVLIEELLPKKYEIQIKKEEYHSWQKNLEIKEKQVTEAKNIILIPEEPRFSILGKEIDNFYFSPDERKIILKERSGESWVLKIYDSERKVKSPLIEEKDISSQGAEFSDLEFSSDSKEIFLEVKVRGKQKKSFALEIDKTPPNLTEKELPPPPKENVITYQKVNGDIYYLDNSGYLFKNNERLTENPLSEIAFKISPDLKKIVYFSGYEIWVLFLEDDLSPAHQKGDKVFIARFSEKIGKVFWYTPYYLIFNVGDKIKIAEIDERDRINIVDLTEFKNPEIFLNQNNKKLYILSEGNLYSSENLLP